MLGALLMITPCHLGQFVSLIELNTDFFVYARYGSLAKHSWTKPLIKEPN
jgi:hypothetical protein